MKIIIQFIVLQWFINISFAQTPPANKVALVIGNAAYTNMGALHNPTNDANAIATFLKENDFQVILGLNLTRRQMEDSIYKFGQLRRTGGISLVYFAGHGVEENGNNYLCPIENPEDDRLQPVEKWVNLNRIKNTLNEKRSRLNLLFLDACRTDMPRGQRIAINPVINPEETIISFAASPGEPAWDGNRDGLSPYTTAVLTAMKTPCTQVTKVTDYLSIIRKAVIASTNELQHPCSHISVTPEAENFFFVCPKTVHTPVWKISTTFNQDCKILYDELHDFVNEVNRDFAGRLQIQWDSTPRPQLRDWLRDLKANRIQMLHGSAIYWKDEIAGAAFFGAIPFGMEQEETERWLRADGLSLWRSLYQPHGIKPFPLGYSGRQMGGWFNKEINTIRDFNGLWMRTSGLAGNVLETFGVQIKLCPASAIYDFLSQDSRNRAAQFIGSYDDYNLGLHNLARYYYETWAEFNTIFELSINQQAFDALDAHTQAQLTTIIRIYNERIYRKYLDKNRAYRSILEQKNVQFRTFPREVLRALREESRNAIQNYIESDKSGQSRIIFESYQRIKRI